MTDSCTVEVITSADRLAELGPTWERLTEQAAVDHPFATYEWIRTWWECFGEDAELRVLLVQCDGQPIAIAPLMRTTQWVYRYLRFLANDHSPRCDFIIAAAKHDLAYAAICKFLMRDGADWDVLQLQDVPAQSETLRELISRSARFGLLSGVRRSCDSPLLVASSDWNVFLQTLSSNRRWFLRNRLRRLEKLGKVELETVSGGDDLNRALEDGYRLEAAAWKEKADTAIRCDERVERFYTTLARRCAVRGWLRLQFLKVNEQRIAFAYSLEFRQRMYLLKPGFDPAYAEYSPGSLLSYLTLEQMYRAGLQAYEFLGNADYWKRQWTSQYVSHCSLFLYLNRPLPRLAHYAKFAVIPALQQLPFYARLRDFVTG